MKKKSGKKSGKSRSTTNIIEIVKPEQKSAPVVLETVPAPAPAQTPKSKRQIPWRYLALISACVLGLALIIWIVGNLFFAKINIGGTVLSGRTSNATLEKTIAAKAANYHLSLVNPDGKTTSYTLSDMGINANPAATVADARKAQHKLSQRLLWWRPVVVKLNTKVNNAALDSFIANHARTVLQPAQDAAFNIGDGTVKITPAANGKQVGLDYANNTLLSSAGKLQNTTLHLRPVTLRPKITEAALTGTKTQLESILGQHITITIGDQTTTPSASDIAAWLTLTPTTTGVNISTNETALNDYLTNLANANSKLPQNQIISDSTGQVVTAGAKGLSVGDTQAAADAIKAGLLAGKGVQTSIPATATNFKTVTMRAASAASASGKSIEIDTTAKRMYAYEDGQLVQTFLISAGAPGTPTPVGHFSIYAKYRSQDMSGPNLDGTRYYQPAVPYVNYFTGAYAIHGNYWRPDSYFGNINSSHGCVGVTVSDGAWIYAWAPIGTPVTVHQ
ncbi:MAG TPA: L,D-transpeptidase family protein [Patescibacteria group bacterium]|nr:L,D-transpeptidase family protein [Patescibacteria group bacterium]